MNYYYNKVDTTNSRIGEGSTLFTSEYNNYTIAEDC